MISQPAFRQSSTAPETPKLGTPQAVVPPLQAGIELRRRALASSSLTQNLSINRIGPAIPGMNSLQTPLPLTPYRPSGKLANAVTPAPS